jgi:trehalose 6-phosphate synthase complex regulatory subunit
MALRTHEFVECQEERHRSLILSEVSHEFSVHSRRLTGGRFVGLHSYSRFRSCIAINPWDMRGSAKVILQALTMSNDEASARWEVRCM